MKCKNCNTEMNTYENIYSCPYCGFQQKVWDEYCYVCGKPCKGLVCGDCEEEIEE